MVFDVKLDDADLFRLVEGDTLSLHSTISIVLIPQYIGVGRCSDLGGNIF